LLSNFLYLNTRIEYPDIQCLDWKEISASFKSWKSEHGTEEEKLKV